MQRSPGQRLYELPLSVTRREHALLPHYPRVQRGWCPYRPVSGQPLRARSGRRTVRSAPTLIRGERFTPARRGGLLSSRVVALALVALVVGCDSEDTRNPREPSNAGATGGDGGTRDPGESGAAGA